MSWSNSDNYDFSSDLDINEMKLMAARSGLESNVDLDIIRSELGLSDVILELGSGYGRVIEYLIQNDFHGEIYGIEWSPTMVSELKSKYQGRVGIIRQDIKAISLEMKFDCILWMWAGINCFSRVEQRDIIHKLKNFMKPGGKIFIDTNISTLPAHATKISDRENKIDHKGKTHHFYIPTPGEVYQWAKEAGFSSTCIRTYEASGGIRRYMIKIEG